MREDAYDIAQFIENPNAIRYPIDGIEKVVILGGKCFVIPGTLVPQINGTAIKTNEHYCEMELWRVPRMIGVITRAIGEHGIVSAFDAATRGAIRALRLH